MTATQASDAIAAAKMKPFGVHQLWIMAVTPVQDLPHYRLAPTALV
jgi:hypothetical protein